MKILVEMAGEMKLLALNNLHTHIGTLHYANTSHTNKTYHNHVYYVGKEDLGCGSKRIA